MRRQNAYVTVALALCLSMALTFCLSLIEGARQNAGRLETECITDIVMDSVLAEYHRQLMEQYNLFAIDSSYGTATYGVENVVGRLEYYLEKNLNYEDIFLANIFYRDFFALKVTGTKVTKVSGIMGGNGAIFRRCGADVIRSDVGLDLFEQVQNWLQVIEVNGLESSDVAGQKALVDEQLNSYDGIAVETEKDVWETVVIDNPTENLEAKRRLGILRLALGEESFLSQAVLNTEYLAGSRMRQGNAYVGEVETDEASVRSLFESFLFREYLLRYMGHYGAESESDVLKYQAEHLIVGGSSDVENLRKVANRICIIREAANLLYLLGNEAKREEVRLVADVVSAVTLLPWLSPLFETVILLGWSFAESVYDVKTLLEGGSIPLLKDDDSWHYGLLSALFGNLEESGSGEEGMSYVDYLRVFLLPVDEDVLTERALNMVEADMRKTPGNENFRLDACFVSLTAEITYESTYGYEYMLVREKKYK